MSHTISEIWPVIVWNIPFHTALRPFKVIDFYVIWKPLCDFLLVINSNLELILHHSTSVMETQTDDNHDNSLTITKVWLANKNQALYLAAPSLIFIWPRTVTAAVVVVTVPV